MCWLRLSLAVVSIGKAFPYATSTLLFYEHTALPQVLALEKRLERAGNALPTFDKIYADFKTKPHNMRLAVEKRYNLLETMPVEGFSEGNRRRSATSSKWLKLSNIFHTTK